MNGPGGLSPEELAYYADGAWYDAEYVHIRGDLAYYASVAAGTAGRVLELACGTGRITLPMARAGGHVLGVDLSPGMIHEAERKRADMLPADRARLAFQVGDMRELRLGEQFGAVIIAFNTLMHMTSDEDLAGALETVRQHLAPDGLFHFDLYTPHPGLLLDRDPEGRHDPQEMVDPAGVRYIVTENNLYDARSQINTLRFYYQRVDGEGLPTGAERCVSLRLRVLFPRELEHWLATAGFQIVEDWDDFEKTTTFSATGGRRIIAAKRAR